MQICAKVWFLGQICVQTECYESDKMNDSLAKAVFRAEKKQKTQEKKQKAKTQILKIKKFDFGGAPNFKNWVFFSDFAQKVQKVYKMKQLMLLFCAKNDGLDQKIAKKIAFFDFWP